MPRRVSFAHLTWHSGTESANRPTAHTVTELTPRRERILRHVVQEYVALAQPVPWVLWRCGDARGDSTFQFRPCDQLGKISINILIRRKSIAHLDELLGIDL